MKQKSRAKRLADAVSQMQEAITQARSAVEGPIEDGKSELEELNSEYEGWKDNLPENLQSSPLGEKLETIVDLLGDLDVFDELNEAFDNIESKLSEIEDADLPQGFGRD